MRVLGTKVALVTGALLLGATVVAPVATASPTSRSAPAQAPGDSYQGTAEASGLLINLFGQELAIGSAQSSVNSPDEAVADGIGALLASQELGSSKATAKGAGSRDGGPDPVCGPLELPAQVPLLDLSSACSSATAEVTDSGALAVATGETLRLELGGDPLVQPLLDQLPITVLTDALISGLAPLLDPLLPLPSAVVTDQVTDILSKALTGDGVSLLTVEVGGSQAETSTTEDLVSALSDARGVVIKLIDRGGDSFGTQPILTVEVGVATASVSRDRATGETTAVTDPVPVRVTVADDIAMLLQLPENSFDVPLGQTLDLPLPSPLDSSITVSEGTSTEVDGGMTAKAATVDLELLKGLRGGVRVSLGSGTASVVGTTAEAPAPAPEAPASPNETQDSPKAAAAPAPKRTSLPRTGINDDRRSELVWTLLASALAAAVLVGWSSRRSRLSTNRSQG